MPQPARLLQKPVAPFEMALAHPKRCSTHITCEKIKQGSGRPGRQRGIRNQTRNYAFLEAVAHGNQHQVRPGLLHDLEDTILIFGEKTMLVAHQPVLRPSLDEYFGSPIYYRRGRAEHEYPERDAAPAKKVWDKVRPIEIVWKCLAVENSARDIETNPVIQEEEILQGIAQ